MCVATPNDPKLSDGGGWRSAGWWVCGVSLACAVTAVAVRWSAWLGDGWIACGLMLAWICIGIAWVILLRIVFEMHQSGLYARNNGKRNGKGEKRDGESDNPPLEREIGAGLDIGLPRQDGQDTGQPRERGRHDLVVARGGLGNGNFVQRLKFSLQRFRKLLRRDRVSACVSKTK